MQENLSTTKIQQEETLEIQDAIEEEETLKKHNNNNNVLRQSGYLVCMISQRDFLLHGAIELPYGLYFKQQHFDGTPNNETVALMGIPLIHITHFFTETSDFIDKIKVIPELQYISKIDQLSCQNTCDVLKKFGDFFESCESHYLLLLNIEPKGEGRYHKIYPNPRFTLPGGTMEECDSNDFFQCAVREFKEETKLTITDDNHTLISQKRIIRDIRGSKKPKTKDSSSSFDSCSKRLSRFNSSRNQNNNTFRHFHKPNKANFKEWDPNKPTKIISMYFAIQIKSGG